MSFSALNFSPKTVSKVLVALCTDSVAKRDPSATSDINDDWVARAAKYGFIVPDNEAANPESEKGASGQDIHPSTPPKMVGDSPTVTAIVTAEKAGCPRKSAVDVASLSIPNISANQSNQFLATLTGAESSTRAPGNLKDDADYDEEPESIVDKTGGEATGAGLTSTGTYGTDIPTEPKPSDSEKGLSETEASNTTTLASNTTAATMDTDRAESDDKELSDIEAPETTAATKPMVEEEESPLMSDDEDEVPTDNRSSSQTEGSDPTDGVSGEDEDESEDDEEMEVNDNTTNTNTMGATITITTTTNTKYVRVQGRRGFMVGKAELVYQADKLTKRQRESYLVEAAVHKGIEYTYGLGPVIKAKKSKRKACVLRGAVRTNLDGLKGALDGLSAAQYDAAIEELKSAKRARR